MNKQAENDNEVITKAHVDQFRRENERSRRDVGLIFFDESNDLVKNNQDNDLNDNKLSNIDSITVNRNPSSDNELANKKYVANELDKNTIVRIIQTLQNYLKVSVGNEIYNLNKFNEIQITDTNQIRSGISGSTVLQGWKIICNDKNNNGKVSNFVKSTKSNSPTVESGATSIPPIGKAFMYIETSGNNFGNGVFVSFERTDIIQITQISF